MDHLILGLLILSPMTGYELQQFIRQNLALICSHSAGSVQTALSKLCKDEKIVAEEIMEGKRRKKTFLITDKGRIAFAEWVAQPMQADRVKNMELSRLFFLGLAKEEERRAAISNYIHQMEQTKEVLSGIRQRFFQIQKEKLPSGMDWEEVLRFQKYTIDYGIAAAEFEREWYSRLLCEMEEHK